MPVLKLVGLGVALIAGLAGFKKLDEKCDESRRDTFKKDVEFLRNQGFNNYEISQILRKKF